MSTTRRNVLFAAAATPAAARVLSASALAALNPAAAKAAMLYTGPRDSWNGRSRRDVSTSLLVAVQNATAASTTPGVIRHHVSQLDLEDSP